MEKSVPRRVLNNRPVIFGVQTGLWIFIFGITAPQLQGRRDMVRTAKPHASHLDLISGAKQPIAGTIVLLCQHSQLTWFDGRLFQPWLSTLKMANVELPAKKVGKTTTGARLTAKNGLTALPHLHRKKHTKENSVWTDVELTGLYQEIMTHH